jgi:hypothetical protein
VATKKKTIAPETAALVRAAMQRKAPSDIKEILGELDSIFGGPAEIANLIHEEIFRTQAGGMMRAKLIEMYVRAKLATREETKPDVMVMGDEDIDREAKELMQKVYDASSTKSPDAESAPGEVPPGSGDSSVHSAVAEDEGDRGSGTGGQHASGEDAGTQGVDGRGNGAATVAACGAGSA